VVTHWYFFFDQRSDLLRAHLCSKSWIQIKKFFERTHLLSELLKMRKQIKTNKGNKIKIMPIKHRKIKLVILSNRQETSHSHPPYTACIGQAVAI